MEKSSNFEESFKKVLMNEDDLGIVIRTHLHVEYEINQLLKVLVPVSEELDLDNLSYSQKVKILFIMGLRIDFKAMLISLGKLRNKFAHELGFKLNLLAVNNLYDSLSETSKEVLHESYMKSIDKPAPTYEELSVKDKFILIVIVIINAIRISKDEVKRQIS